MKVCDYKGYEIHFTHISYNCPKLKFYGYSTETKVKRAIDKYLKAKENK